MKAKPMIIGLASVGTASIVALTGLHSVNAQSDADTLPEKIANAFSLDQDKVQEIFDEHREALKAERQQAFTDQLQDKVDEGTITEEQKKLIEEKIEELHAQHEELKESDLSRSEIHDQMKESRAELEAWAEENNIPFDILRPGGNHGFRGGRHFKEMR